MFKTLKKLFNLNLEESVRNGVIDDQRGLILNLSNKIKLYQDEVNVWRDVAQKRRGENKEKLVDLTTQLNEYKAAYNGLLQHVEKLELEQDAAQFDKTGDGRQSTVMYICKKCFEKHNKNGIVH